MSPNGHGDRLEIEPSAPLAIDTIRALFTYTLTIVVVIGGGFMLFATRNEPNAANLQVMVAGFIGASLSFAYSQEVQTRTARQAAASTAASTAANVAQTAAANSGVGNVAPAGPDRG